MRSGIPSARGGKSRGMNLGLLCVQIPSIPEVQTPRKGLEIVNIFRWDLVYADFPAVYCVLNGGVSTAPKA